MLTKLQSPGVARGLDGSRQDRQLSLPGYVAKTRYDKVLLDTRQAMAELEYSAQTIREMTDLGELRWVWDVSLKQADIEARRFWYGELKRVKAGDFSAIHFQPDDVISAVVGHETQARLRSHTVCQMLVISNPTLQYLHQAGELAGDVTKGVRWTDRTSLVAFLRRRLIS